MNKLWEYSMIEGLCIQCKRWVLWVISFKVAFVLSQFPLKVKSYYNSSSVCLFVPYLLRGLLRDLRQTWWVHVGGPPICSWGVLFRKVNGSTGQRGHFHFPLYYICASLTPHSCKRPLLLCCCSSKSLFWRLLLHCISTVYVVGPRNCPWGVLFWKGQWVDGSTGQTGQRVTFTLTILYMIADDARLTPHHCKKHTAFFARSTGKFPSEIKYA